jgi:hypothetical protein
MITDRCVHAYKGAKAPEWTFDGGGEGSVPFAWGQLK